jgi:hypothetical protein
VADTPDDEIRKRFSPEAREAYLEFEEKWLRFTTAIRRTPLSVLVWGPGEGKAGDALVNRRQQIYEDIRDQSNFAAYSEWLGQFAPPETPVWVAELSQALASDLIVILDESPGALAEIAKFSEYREIAEKFLILAPERHRGGFADDTFLRGRPLHVEYYSDGAVAELFRFASEYARVKSADSMGGIGADDGEEAVER